MPARDSRSRFTSPSRLRRKASRPLFTSLLMSRSTVLPVRAMWLSMRLRAW